MQPLVLRREGGSKGQAEGNHPICTNKVRKIGDTALSREGKALSLKIKKRSNERPYL